MTKSLLDLRLKFILSVIFLGSLVVSLGFIILALGLGIAYNLFVFIIS